MKTKNTFVKIENTILPKKDVCNINQTLSQFYNNICKIKVGYLCERGKTCRDKKHYVIDAEDKRSSIKLPLDNNSHDLECAIHEIRKLCDINNYKVKIIDGFSMNGEKWRKGNVLLIEWGKKNHRFDLFDDEQEVDEKDKNIFLKQMAINSAFVYYLDIKDRHGHNFVWDKQEKTLFSIDHEKLLHCETDDHIILCIASILEKLCGKEWYKNEEFINCFKCEFKKTWKLMKSQNIEIKNILKKYNQSFNQNDEKRIKKNANITCNKIMMPLKPL